MFPTMDARYREVFSNPDLTDLVLTSKEIANAMLSAFPDTNPASLNISDRAESPAQATQYGLHCFAREKNGYRVLPVAEWIEKPKSSGSRGQSSADAAISLAAKIAAKKAADSANNGN